MAAILCKGIGDLCSMTCTTIGHICLLPIKACDACCVGCGELSQILCQNPLSAVVVVTLIGQLPPIIIGLLELAGLPDCPGSLWLLSSSIFAVIHIIAAFYLALRVGNTQDASLQHLPSAFKRTMKLLCHDPWMAAYILILIGFLVFLVLGSSWRWSGHLEDDESCSDSVQSNASLVLAFGWFFLFGGAMALSCNLCCACFDQRDYGSGGNNQTPGPGPSAAFNQSQAPSGPDVETPEPNYHTTDYGTASKPTPPPPYNPHTTYNAQGIPEPEIPMAYAEAIPDPPPQPQPSHPTAPPSKFDTNASRSGASATPPSGPGDASNDNGNGSGAAKAVGSVGSAVGKNLGKLFFKDDANKQHDLENKGKQAGQAVGKGLSTAKNFLQSQLEKHQKKDGNNRSG